jgi:hypothetical protein
MPRRPSRVRSVLAAAVGVGLVATLTAYAADQQAANGLTPGTDVRKATTQPGPSTPAATALLADVLARQAAGAFAHPAAGAPVVGPDYVASPNVSLLHRIPLPADGVGARVVGNFLYVTSTKDLEIYDISTPTSPVQVGAVNLDVEFENEQVPTDGSLLGISGQTSTVTVAGPCTPAATTPSTYKANCLALFDVRHKATPVQVAAVGGAGDHTSTCLTVAGQSCAYFYGSSGRVTDARQALTRHRATLLSTNWQTALKARYGVTEASCHHQVQLRPGVLLTACQPMALISVNQADGGSITRPALLATADYSRAPDDRTRFIHGVEWARGGTDKIMLSGGETNFTGVCTPTAGAFSTFLVGGTAQHPSFTFADQVRPHSGQYVDGNPPDGGYSFGCSSHWFEPQPAFHNGGLVALASYENGTRIKRISSSGKITEVGFFEPLGGSTSAPHWAKDGRTIYAIDYHRGIDVLHYNGPLP